MKTISKLILKLIGWKIKQSFQPSFAKYIIIQAPHTSNWDFVLGKLLGYSVGIYPKIFIKESLFFFPLGYLLKHLGGVPVSQSKKNNLVSEMAYQMSVNDKFALVLTPEGTRSYSPKWKKGFYYISKATQVPVVPFFIDYEKKIIGFDDQFELSDDVDADIEKLKIYFSQFKGKNPENGVR